ncbi:hypothetical protein RYA05_05420 [Pseudomonas syringae pv. actinidiae]|nr:hypothetical protein [Pseudomonas syringae pv. actinidiae]
MLKLTPADRDSLFAQIRTTVPHVLENVAADWLDESAQVIAKDIEIGAISGDSSKKSDYEQLVSNLRWHIRRKKTFGASDMSCLYMEFKDQWYPFGEAADIVKQKLCLQAVEPMTGDTSRGTFMEGEARRKFIKYMQRQGIYLESDDSSRQKISDLRFAGGIPGLEWADCSPDDIFLDQDLNRYLVDYKCPAETSSVEDMLSSPPDYYKAQLGQELIILDYLGVKVDRTMLVPMSYKDFDVFPVDCHIDNQMLEDIVSAGNHYWGYVERNEFPKRPYSKNYEFVEQMTDEVQNIVLELALHQKGRLLHEGEEKKLKRRLEEVLTINKIDIDDRDKKVSIPLVDIKWTERETLNQEAVKAFIKKEQGIDIEADEHRAQFYRTTCNRSVTMNRSSKTRYAPISTAIEGFMVGKVAEMRVDVVGEFKSKFQTRDSVVPDAPKAKAGKSAKTTVNAEPSF